jgi:cytochrome c oxidase subunit 4
MAAHHPPHHEHGGAEEHSAHHVVSPSTYYKVFAALMVLLVLTLVAAYFDLGELNLIIAITIAVVKALLILLFFMHLIYSSRLVQLFGGAALFWLAILFILTLGDYFARRGPMLPQ